ncbi:MAG: glycoside hydrolase family 55 protein, partial [Planctomycetaceae bacterium]|nr:glycoside hydrolase family 55 protein [Planctomycetaceae bacterium]
MKRIVFFSVVVLVCCMNLFSATEIFAQLAGDGVADDTQAIQTMLDSGEKLVYLPPPAKHYVISKPLRIHSNQTLKLDAATVVRLADGSDNYMLVNADPDKGNENIVISGGIWDGNNIKINHAKGNRNGVHPHQFF